MYGIFRNEEPDFIKGHHHGRLSKFRLRGIYAVDSTTIQLAFWCIDWAKHRQKKAAVKVHVVANVANRLPHFCVFGKAKDHDSKMEDELFNSLKESEIYWSRRTSVVITAAQAGQAQWACQAERIERSEKAPRVPSGPVFYEFIKAQALPTLGGWMRIGKRFTDALRDGSSVPTKYASELADTKRDIANATYPP